MPMVIQIKLFQSFRLNVLNDLFQHINYGFILYFFLGAVDAL
jgi:hypothetical protein